MQKVYSDMDMQGNGIIDLGNFSTSNVYISQTFDEQNITSDCTLIRCSGSIVIASGVTVNAIDCPGLTTTGGGTLLRNGYAVGDFFIGTNSPAERAGGEWTQLAAGQTVVSSGADYPLGGTGGTDSVTLTLEQIPSHNGHVPSDASNWGGTFSGKFISVGSDIFSQFGDPGRGWNIVNGNEVLPFGRTLGNGQAHENMPPYYVTNIWRRTA